MANKPHLGLIYDENIPSDIVDQFSQTIEKESLNFKRQSVQSRGPQNNLELLSWPAIALMIAAPYFASFLNEAGKDHYKILKSAILHLWHYLRKKITNENDDFKFALMTSKGVVKTEYSLLFSIYTRTSNGMVVKFLIREDWTEKESEAAIGAFLNLLESYHMSHEQPSIDLDNEKDIGGFILISFDIQTRSLHVVHLNK